MMLLALAPVRAFGQEPSVQRKPIAVVVRISTPPLFTPDGKPAPDRTERLQALADALDALQASDIAGVPIGTIMSRLARARRQLQMILSKSYTQ